MKDFTRPPPFPQHLLKRHLENIGWLSTIATASAEIIVLDQYRAKREGGGDGR